MQAVSGPGPDGEQVDPDLKAAVFALGLQDGNQTAYDLVLGVFLDVSPGLGACLPCMASSYLIGSRFRSSGHQPHIL